MREFYNRQKILKSKYDLMTVNQEVKVSHKPASLIYRKGFMTM